MSLPTKGLLEIAAMSDHHESRATGTIVHASCTRSWYIVEKALELWKLGVPADQVMGIVEELRNAPEVER